MADDDRAEPPPFVTSLRTAARELYGHDAAGYDAGRPEYPDQVYAALTGRCGLGPGTRVLEIGPGTGQVTRRLVALGADVTAVEPDPAMADYLVSTVAADVIRSAFEDASLPESRFDLAVAATSFHWVEQAVGLRKVGRVVRPGGWVALWWTLFEDPSRPDPFLDALLEQLGDNSDPAARTGFQLDESARRDDLRRHAGLADVEAELIHWTARFDAAGVRALHASMIDLRRRPEAERNRILDTLEALARERFGGVVERPFVTALYTGRRA